MDLPLVERKPPFHRKNLLAPRLLRLISLPRLVSMPPLLFILLITACQPAPTTVPRPTPTALTVQSTPALLPLTGDYRACVEELQNTGLVLLETHAASLDLNPSALALRWGPGQGTDQAAYIIGQEDLVIIAHPQNPLERIALADLQAIYSGALRLWPASAPELEVQPWGYLSGDDVQAIFETAVLGGQPASTRVVFQAPDPAAMREAVAADPAAIGFLPRRWLNGAVKELPVEGLAPGQTRQPILALSRSEPQGVEKSWLLCLQERLSQ